MKTIDTVMGCTKHPFNVSPICLYCAGERLAKNDREDPMKRKTKSFTHGQRETPEERRSRVFTQSHGTRPRSGKLVRGKSFMEHVCDALTMARPLSEDDKMEVLQNLIADIHSRRQS